MESCPLAKLPEPGIGLFEAALDLVDELFHDLEGGARWNLADEARVEEETADREHHLAVDVVLEVLERLIPYADGAVPVVAGQVLELTLGRL